ncbi:MAG: hypothetical protein EPN93_08005 [Spirochaetes bacterium]|nr:MAG: hypothetical protein EPN93_08005 [Spirochaetota bacterium]
MKKLCICLIALCALIAGNHARGELRLKEFSDTRTEVRRYLESASSRRMEAEWERMASYGASAVRARWERESEKEIAREAEARTAQGEDAAGVEDSLRALLEQARARFDRELDRETAREKASWYAGLVEIAVPPFARETLRTAIREADMGAGAVESYRDAYALWEEGAGGAFISLWETYENGIRARRDFLVSACAYADEMRDEFIGALDARLGAMKERARADEEIYLAGARNAFIGRRLEDTDSLRRDTEERSAEAVSRRILEATRARVEDLMERGLGEPGARAGSTPADGLSGARALIDAGISVWRDAEEELLAARMAWERDRAESFDAAEGEWASSWNRIREERRLWMEDIDAQIGRGESMWLSSLGNFDEDRARAAEELREYVRTEGGQWDEYITGIKRMVDTGSGALTGARESIYYLDTLIARYRDRPDKSALMDALVAEKTRWENQTARFQGLLVRAEIELRQEYAGSGGNGTLTDDRGATMHVVYTELDASGTPYVVFEGTVANGRDPYLMTKAEYDLEKLRIEEEYWKRRMAAAQGVYEYAFAGAARPGRDEQERARLEALDERDRKRADLDRAETRLTEVFLNRVNDEAKGVADAQEALQLAQLEFDRAEELFGRANARLMYLENPDSRELLLEEITALVRRVSELERVKENGESLLLRYAREYYAARRVEEGVASARDYEARLADAIAVVEGDADSQGYRGNLEAFGAAVTAARGKDDAADALAAETRAREDEIFATVEKADPYYMDGENVRLSSARAGLAEAHERYAIFKRIAAEMDAGGAWLDEAVFELLPPSPYGDGTQKPDFETVTSWIRSASTGDFPAVEELCSLSGGRLGPEEIYCKGAGDIARALSSLWAADILGTEGDTATGPINPEIEERVRALVRSELSARRGALMGALAETKNALDGAFESAKEVVKYLLSDFTGSREITAATPYSRAWMQAELDRTGAAVPARVATSNLETVRRARDFFMSSRGSDYETIRGALLARRDAAFAGAYLRGLDTNEYYICDAMLTLVESAEFREGIRRLNSAGEDQGKAAWDEFLRDWDREALTAEYAARFFSEILPRMTEEGTVEAQYAAWSALLEANTGSDGNILAGSPMGEEEYRELVVRVAALSDPGSVLLFAHEGFFGELSNRAGAWGVLSRYAEENYGNSREHAFVMRQGLLRRVAEGAGVIYEDLVALMNGGAGVDQLKNAGARLAAYAAGEDSKNLPETVREALAGVSARFAALRTAEFISAHRDTGVGGAEALKRDADDLARESRTLMEELGSIVALYRDNAGNGEAGREAVFGIADIEKMDAVIATLAGKAGALEAHAGAEAAGEVRTLVERLRAAREEYLVEYYAHEFLSDPMGLYPDDLDAFREHLENSNEGPGLDAELSRKIAGRIEPFDTRGRIARALGPRVSGSMAEWLDSFLRVTGKDPASIPDAEMKTYADFAAMSYLDSVRGSTAEGMARPDEFAGEFRAYACALRFLDYCRREASEGRLPEYAAAWAAFAADNPSAALSGLDLHYAYDAAASHTAVFIERELDPATALLSLRGDFYSGFMAGEYLDVDEFLDACGLAPGDEQRAFFREGLDTDERAYEESMRMGPGADVEAYLDARRIEDEALAGRMRAFAAVPDGLSPYACLEMVNECALALAARGASSTVGELIGRIAGGDGDARGLYGAVEARYAVLLGDAEDAAALLDYAMHGANGSADYRSAWSDALANWDYYIGKFVEAGRDARFVVVPAGEKIPRDDDGDGKISDIETARYADDLVIRKLSRTEYEVPDGIMATFMSEQNEYPLAARRLEAGFLAADRAGESTLGFVDAGVPGHSLDNGLVEALTGLSRALERLKTAADVEETALASLADEEAGGTEIADESDLIRAYREVYNVDTGRSVDSEGEVLPWGQELEDMIGRIRAQFDTPQLHSAAEKYDRLQGALRENDEAKSRIAVLSDILDLITGGAEGYLQGSEYGAAKDAHGLAGAALRVAEDAVLERQAAYRAAQEGYIGQLNVIAALYAGLKNAQQDFDTKQAVYEYASSAYLYASETGADDAGQDNGLAIDAAEEFGETQTMYRACLERLHAGEREVERVKEQRVTDDAGYVRVERDLVEKASRAYRIAKVEYLVRREVEERSIAYERARAEYDELKNAMLASAPGEENARSRDRFLDWLMKRDYTLDAAPLSSKDFSNPWKSIFSGMLRYILPPIVMKNDLSEVARWYDENVEDVYRTEPLAMLRPVVEALTVTDAFDPEAPELMDYMEQAYGEDEENRTYAGGEIHATITTYARQYLGYRDNVAKWFRYIGGGSAFLVLYESMHKIQHSIKSVERKIDRVKWSWMKKPLKALLSGFRYALKKAEKGLDQIAGNMDDVYRKAATNLKNASAQVRKLNEACAKLRERKSIMQKAGLGYAALTQIESLDDDGAAGVIAYRDEKGNSKTMDKQSLKTVIREIAARNGAELREGDLDLLVRGASGENDPMNADLYWHEAPRLDQDLEETDQHMRVWNAAEVCTAYGSHLEQGRLDALETYLDYTSGMSTRGDAAYDETVVLRAREKLFGALAAEIAPGLETSAAEAGRENPAYRKAMTEYAGILEGFTVADLRELERMEDSHDPAIHERFAELVRDRQGVNDLELSRREALQEYAWGRERDLLEQEHGRWNARVRGVFNRGNRQWDAMERAFIQEWKQWRREAGRRALDEKREWEALSNDLKERERAWLSRAYDDAGYKDTLDLATRLAEMVNGMIADARFHGAERDGVSAGDARAVLSDLMRYMPGRLTDEFIQSGKGRALPVTMTGLSARKPGGTVLDDFQGALGEYGLALERTSRIRQLEWMNAMADGYRDSVARMNEYMHTEIDGLLMGYSYVKADGNEYRKTENGFDFSIGGYRDYTADAESLLDGRVSYYLGKLKSEGSHAAVDLLSLDDPGAGDLMKTLMTDLELAFGKEIENAKRHMGEYSQYNGDGERTGGGTGERARILDRAMHNEKKIGKSLANRTIALQGISAAASFFGPVGIAVSLGIQSLMLAERAAEGNLGRGEMALSLVQMAATAAGGYVKELQLGAYTTAGIRGGIQLAASGAKLDRNGGLRYEITRRDAFAAGTSTLLAMAGTAGGMDKNLAYNFAANYANAGIAQGRGEWYEPNLGADTLAIAAAETAAQRASGGTQNAYEEKMAAGLVSNSLLMAYKLGSRGGRVDDYMLTEWNWDAARFTWGDLAGIMGEGAGRGSARYLEAREQVIAARESDSLPREGTGADTDPLRRQEDASFALYEALNRRGMLSGAFNGMLDSLNEFALSQGLGQRLGQSAVNWMQGNGFVDNNTRNQVEAALAELASQRRQEADIAEADRMWKDGTLDKLMLLRSGKLINGEYDFAVREDGSIGLDVRGEYNKYNPVEVRSDVERLAQYGPGIITELNSAMRRLAEKGYDTSKINTSILAQSVCTIENYYTLLKNSGAVRNGNSGMESFAEFYANSVMDGSVRLENGFIDKPAELVSKYTINTESIELCIIQSWDEYKKLIQNDPNCFGSVRIYMPEFGPNAGHNMMVYTENGVKYLGCTGWPTVYNGTKAKDSVTSQNFWRYDFLRVINH